MMSLLLWLKLTAHYDNVVHRQILSGKRQMHICIRFGYPSPPPAAVLSALPCGIYTRCTYKHQTAKRVNWYSLSIFFPTYYTTNPNYRYVWRRASCRASFFPSSIVRTAWGFFATFFLLLLLYRKKIVFTWHIFLLCGLLKGNFSCCTPVHRRDKRPHF